MLKVKSIKSNVVISWLYMGYPATIITLLKNGKKTEENEVIDAVKEKGHKVVVINGNITENPEVRPLILWLSSVWYKIIVSTEGHDDITPLRSVRNCNFLIKITAPTETQNSVNASMLPYLKPEDELLFILDTDTQYENTIRFLNSKMITKPTITFVVEEGSKMKEKVITDSSSFRFSCRILPTRSID